RARGNETRGAQGPVKKQGRERLADRQVERLAAGVLDRDRRRCRLALMEDRGEAAPDRQRPARGAPGVDEGEQDDERVEPEAREREGGDDEGEDEERPRGAEQEEGPAREDHAPQLGTSTESRIPARIRSALPPSSSASGVRTRRCRRTAGAMRLM